MLSTIDMFIAADLVTVISFVVSAGRKNVTSGTSSCFVSVHDTISCKVSGMRVVMGLTRCM